MKAAACTILLFVLTSSFALAQVSSELPDAPKPTPTSGDDPQHGIKYIAVRLVKDQRDIYTAPFRPSNYQAKYIIPFVIVAAFIPADRYLSGYLPTKGYNAANTFSNVALGSTGAVAAGLFLYGSMENDDHARETGLLTAESFANSAALYAVTNVIAGRQRPNEGNGHGDFFQNNALDSSFPSGHATLQFSMSSVLAHEYPSLGSKFLWYGLGTAVAASRVVGRDHFPSDVIMGGTLGYLVGTHIYHAHSSRVIPKDKQHTSP
jgi:membrane-associated phospholipid phosphatase